MAPLSHKEINSASTPDRRLVAIRLATGGLLLLAVISQARVHLLQRGSIMDQARKSKRFIVEKKEPAIRGAIYSADGKALSQADDRRLLVIDFRKVPHSPGFFMALGAASGISASELTNLALSGQKVVEWDRTFTPAQSEAIQQVKRKWRADGIGTRLSSNRAYGLGESAASLVGIYRADGAKLGVEQAFDETLKGEDGRIVGMVDKEGQYLPMRVDRSTKRKTDGRTVTLTIDSELQSASYEAIKSAVKARHARQGAVVIMDPNTGNVLACASYPSFDPTRPFRETKEGEIPDGYATAFQASLEPGSTFKIATVAKAIDEGVLTSSDVVRCDGDFTVGGRTIHCDRHGGSRAHGQVNPEQAIERSCNVAAAQYALRVGTEKFNAYLQDVGLLDRHPLGLPGEPRPQYDLDAPAPKLHLANVGFGQSINVTPIALATSFCAIANGGVAVKPRLIDRIGEQIQPVEKGKRVLKPQTCETVLEYMRSVISSDHGTGKTLRIPGYDLGGKTGTAQKTNQATRSMKGGGYVANFVGFVPVSSPRAVILVMVDDPQGQEYYGAQVAGPVFLEVARHAIKRLSIPRGVLPTKFAQIPSEPAAGEAVAMEATKVAAPTLTVKSRLVGDRTEARVIGRRDQPLNSRPRVEDIVDRRSRQIVSERDDREKTDPRLKMRKETDEIVRRVTAKVDADRPKTSARKADSVKEESRVTQARPKRTTKSQSLGNVETEDSRGITIRSSTSTKPKSGSSAKKEPAKSSTKDAPRLSIRKSGTSSTTAKSKDPKPMTTVAHKQSSAKTPVKSATKTSSTKSRTTSVKQETSGSRKTTVAKTADKPKAETKTATTSNAAKSAKTTTKPVATKKPTAKVATKSAETRMRELEQENLRLRKLLDSRSGKATSVKKSSGKAEAPTRKQSDSKRPSNKRA